MAIRHIAYHALPAKCAWGDQVEISAVVYEKRLLLFADILGWSAANIAASPDVLLAAIRELHDPAETYSEALKAQMKGAIGTLIHTEIGPMELSSVNPMWLDVQFGAFSDNIVISMPSSFGARITQQVSPLIRTLLRKGFLLRGAVTIGDLYHKDSAVFGTPLIEAVALEKASIHPRIVINGESINEINSIGYDRRDICIIQDQCGDFVVNPFSIPLDGPDDFINSFIEGNFHFREIKSVISNQIRDLRANGRYAQEAKWQYMQDFIEVCVLPTNALLEAAWRDA